MILDKKYWLLYIFTALLINFSALAQEVGIKAKKEKWYKPDHIKLQYAGGIGFLSPAIGISFAKEKIQSDLFVGYVPKGVGGLNIWMITLKNTYFPFTIKPLRSDITIYPLSIGGYINYTIGDQYETFYPDYYPDGYYWWDSALRLGIFLGGKISKPLNNFPFNRASIYYEVGTNDLYLVSYFENLKYFKPYDILNIAIGVEMSF